MTALAASRRRLAYIAWAAVCLIWGTTYLGIRVSLESVPPALMGGIRWLIAGGLLTAYLVARGRPLPPVSQWGAISLLGFLMLGLGNGGVVFAEQYVPSRRVKHSDRHAPILALHTPCRTGPGGHRLSGWTEHTGQRGHQARGRVRILPPALGYPDLTRPLLAAEGGHGAGEHVPHRRGRRRAAGGGRLGHRSTLTARTDGAGRPVHSGSRDRAADL